MISMEKQTMVALVVLALLASASAAPGRFLLAANYDCDGLKMMNSVPNACSMLCDCVGNLNSLYAMFKNVCMDRCNGCAAAAQQCTTPGMPLPSACQGSGGMKEVSTCINQFLSQHQITNEKAPVGQQQKPQQQQKGQQQQVQQLPKGQKPANVLATQQG